MLSAVTAVNEKYLLATGGLSPSQKCEYYSIEEDVWSDEVPDLNHGRRLHSSCAFNEKQVYVFGGKGRGNAMINIIEKLDFYLMQNGWTIIDPLD